MTENDDEHENDIAVPWESNKRCPSHTLEEGKRAKCSLGVGKGTALQRFGPPTNEEHFEGATRVAARVALNRSRSQ
jgi:hypothetical protein